ncbi:MAG: PIG-L family deacetylase [Gemmatimonadota bacterium]
MKHLLTTILWVAAVLLPTTSAAAQSALQEDGAAALGVALRRLGTTKRVLMIAAHPDDENTALIAELALGDGADVAYLSLTRGEGGQNLIGPELQEGLGLIRTEELLAARRLDGARQFFTRAYDYGFSRSAAEAFTQWPRDSLLADVVAVVRRYRPDVIVSIFGGTPADGHGQHQAAGILARDAFAAARDPARFPMQLAAGLEPHAPAYLFQAQYRPSPDARIRVATGQLDPLFGRSRYQIAMQSRSRHRSQDMGRAEPIGPQSTSLELMAGPYPADGQSLFAALDTTLSQHARSIDAPASIVVELERYESTAAVMRDGYNPLDPAAIASVLAANLGRLQRIRLPESPDFALLRAKLDAEVRDAADAVRIAAGVVVDVVADTRYPVPGESFTMTVTTWNGGGSSPRLLAVRPLLPAEWTFDAPAADTAALLVHDAVVRRSFRIHVPRNAQPTEPYFLRQPRTASVYAWPTDSARMLPFQPAAVRVAVELEVGGRLIIERDAEYVDVDKAVGEVRRPLIVVPRVSVAVEPRVVVVPARGVSSRTVTVTVAAAAATGAAGTLSLAVPDGWRVEPSSVTIELARAGDASSVAFTLTPPPDAAGQATIRAVLESAGRTYDRGYVVIDYPHINPHALYRDAAVRAFAFPVALAPDLLVGYIEGAGDDGADALRQLGAAVELLDGDALANADLSRFDAIVAGIRAYEVRPDLVAGNQRVLDYAEAGGTFIVQYNKYELVDGGFMPFPATMARPHGRVTDEHAAVTLLDTAHPVLNAPNRITAADFDGWVHERGLYFLDEMDPRYTPLLAMADNGETPLNGALVAARVGNGWYVYAGLAFFRQLPEGVPGAYRLLANLVSLGRAPD